MALYREVEYEDGSREKIPAFNWEWFELDDDVTHVRIRSEPIASRDSLTERRYQSTDIEFAIQELREGDRVSVKVYPSSYPDRELEIVKNQLEQVIGRDSQGREFYLISRFWGSQNQGDGQPWVRTFDGYKSRGEIEELEILELADD